MTHMYRIAPAAVRACVGHLERTLTELMQREVDSGTERFEEELTSALAEAGREMMAAWLSNLDPQGMDVMVDGERHWETVRCPGRYMTSFGEVKVQRGLYRARRNGPTVCPVEIRGAILNGFWTSRAARLSLELVAPLRQDSCRVT